MAVRVLEETGLLPHLNPGVMSWEELNRLKPVSPSMGMMLETTSRRLFETKGEAHYGSPDKDPEVRMRVLEDAGRLSIPFTTGLLVGIGETLEERAETIFALRQVSRAFGAVQEVIVQNFRAKPDTAMRHADDLDLDEYRATIAVTRIVLGPKARVQAPPNLVDLDGVPAAARRRRRRLGRRLAADPRPRQPRAAVAVAGAAARPHRRSAASSSTARLTVHPEYVRAGEPWLDPRVSGHVAALADRRRPGAARRTPGRAAVAGARRRVRERRPHRPLRGRRQPRAAPTTGAPTSPTCTATGTRSSTRPTAPAVARRCCDRPRDHRTATALKAAEKDPGNLSDEHALTLMTAEGDLLREVCRLADDLRRETVGDDVTYVVNRNINFTNVCYVGCRFCAFAQRRTDADAYSLSLDEVADRAEEAWDLGATEVCMQGGIDPELPGAAYFDLVSAVKQRVPEMHVHAFSPMEIVNGTARTGLSIEDFLIKAREAGLGSLPGTAAEILDDEVRWVLTKGKLPTKTWVEIVSHRAPRRASRRPRR